MRRKYLSLLLTLAALALGVAATGSASAATLREKSGSVFQAVYGNPGTNGETLPVGGGLGRNFGFGANLLFRSSTGAGVGENLGVTIEGVALEAKDSYIGATLLSNKTGENNPLSVAVQFADFQDSTVAGTAAPTFTDTQDRHWLGEICSPASTTCKVDAQFTAPAASGAFVLQDVSFEVATAGGPLVVQGWVWGVWENGTASAPPCLKLEKPAAANPTLVVTQTFTGGPAVGAKAEAVKGKACLISANNYYYKIKSGEEKIPQIEIEK